MLMSVGWSAPAKVAHDEVDWPATLGCVGTLVFVVALVALAAVVSKKHNAKAAEERRLKAAAISEAQIQWAETQARWAAQAKQAQWDDLCRRFGPENAARVLRREVWQGQTQEMLLESCGRPADVDEQVMKTKTKHVFKYQPTGANRYALRVTLEDGVVVGWDDKR